MFRISENKNNMVVCWSVDLGTSGDDVRTHRTDVVICGRDVTSDDVKKFFDD